MSVVELFLLTAPEAQVVALRKAHTIAKNGGDADTINSTKRAVASFTAGKDT